MFYLIVDTRTDEVIALGTATFNPHQPDVEVWNHMNRLVLEGKCPSKNLLVGHTEQSSQFRKYMKQGLTPLEA